VTDIEARIVDRSAATNVNDGLQNMVTRLGTTRDPARYNRFVLRNWVQKDFDTAYRNWMVKKCVDIPVDDVFRKDRYVVVSDDAAEKIEAFYALEDVLSVKSKMAEAAKLGRLYGGALLILGTDDAAWNAPLSKTSKLTHLVVVGRFDVTSVSVNTSDIKKPNYRKPEFYAIGSAYIHYTRVIQFDGDPLPFLAYQENNNWHGSIVQRLNDAIEPAQAAVQNCATLISQMSTDVFKTPDFMAKLASVGEESAMIRRFETAAMMRSNLNMMVLDSEEEYTRCVAQLSGLPDAMISFIKLVAGAADIPFSRFLGESASGLNTTGDGDRRNYEDMVKSVQNTIYAPRYAQIDPLLCNAIWGATPEGFKSRFEPMAQMSDLERADIELKRAQRDTAYITAGVITPDIAARQLDEDETYSGIDEEYISALESYKSAPDTGVVQ
jgi:uncharacterized protein